MVGKAAFQSSYSATIPRKQLSLHSGPSAMLQHSVGCVSPGHLKFMECLIYDVFTRCNFMTSEGTSLYMIFWEGKTM